MSLSMAAGMIESSSQARSWTARLRSVWRPVLLCDLLVVVLLASWAGSRLDLARRFAYNGVWGSRRILAPPRSARRLARMSLP